MTMIIENDEEHRVMTDLLEDLMIRTPGSLAISVVAKLIEEYELKRWPLPEPTDKERRDFRAEQDGLVLCECAGAADCAVEAGKLVDEPGHRCCVQVCKERGHVPSQKMSATICSRCSIVLAER